MSETSKLPNIKQSCHAANRLVDLQTILNGLERCQKSLNDYLDSKRNAFPRFFFISDDELLSILGSSEQECVQEHMIKMFDNVAALRFGKGPNGECIASAMLSAENEVMEFKQHVVTEGRGTNYYASAVFIYLCAHIKFQFDDIQLKLGV